ncbi:MAG: GlsB/YeaQ/YmgE family stress response membrane protein [Xanthomonadaceae bacterium]|jgi:uncharacterized membrane protein YeaQ/YmgE (transglycosylase-associated protein family)|nr:GlsB/YeaQ/YmgE family stress response membrane protein [Xanthomonadaceae bacterium]
MDFSFLGHGWVQVLLLGFLAGLLARWILPGRQKMGLILTTLLGMAGAICASWLLDTFDITIGGPWMRFAAAVGGAIGLLALVQALRNK